MRSNESAEEVGPRAVIENDSMPTMSNLVNHVLFHFLAIPFLALSGYACHVLSYWHRMRQCIIGYCHFSLVSCLPFKSQPLYSEFTSFFIHRSGHFSGFFQRSQKFHYDWSPEELLSSIKLGGHLGTHQSIWRSPPRRGERRRRIPLVRDSGRLPPRNRDF